MPEKIMSRLKARILWAVAFDRKMQAARPAPDPNLREVYDRRGIAFVHIPKTGGTSVERALYNYSVKHRTWREIRDLDPEAWERWRKFAVSRDPIERFLSSFDYLSKGGRNEHDWRVGRRLIGGRQVNDFVARLRKPTFRKRALSYFHFRPQADYVMDGDRLMVDRVIPIERLSTELPAFADLPAASVPRLNVTEGKRTPRKALTDASLGILHEVYSQDFKLHQRALADFRGSHDE